MAGKRRRALVSLPEGVWRILDELKGSVGNGDSDVIRNIVMIHLSERGLLLPSHKIRGVTNPLNRASNAEIFMLTALAELLEEKGLIKYSEWERRLKRSSDSGSVTQLLLEPKNRR